MRKASNAARGSNADTAAADQLVNLKWHSDKDDDPRVELHTEGRGGNPLHLVIEQVDRCQWNLHGDAREMDRMWRGAELGITARMRRKLERQKMRCGDGRSGIESGLGDGLL